MKHAFRILPLSLMATVLAFSLVVINKPAEAAGSGTMFLSPASATVVDGNNLTVSVYEDSGSDSINAVTADISYPTSSLSLVSVTPNSSTFGVQAPSSSGSGQISINEALIGSVSGQQLVGTIVFTAIENSGTATLSFGSGSTLASSTTNENILGSTTGGSYTLSGTASAPPDSGSSSSSSSASSTSSSSKSSTSSTKSSGSTSPSSSSTSTKAAAVSAPTISAISVSGLSYDTATINWQTSTPTSSEVDYGLSTTYELVASSSSLVTQHKVVLPTSTLAGGETFHFRVKDTDSSGNTVTSQDQTFSTPGINLKVTVVNQKNKVVKGAKVTIDGKSATTDSSGHASFSNLPVGTLTASILFSGKTTKEVINLSDTNPSGMNQTVQLKINTGGSILVPVLLVVVIAGAALIGGGYVFSQRLAAKRELERHFPTLPNNPTPTPPDDPVNPVAVPTDVPPTTPTEPGDPGTIIKPGS